MWRQLATFELEIILQETCLRSVFRLIRSYDPLEASGIELPSIAGDLRVVKEFHDRHVRILGRHHIDYARVG